MLLATEGFLRAINLSETDITKYRDMLAESSSSLKELAGQQGKAAALDGAFGASSKGNSLAWHTAMAQQRVISEIDMIAAGLQGYNENIRLHLSDNETTDTHNAAFLRTYQNATECVQVQDSCAAPEDGR